MTVLSRRTGRIVNNQLISWRPLSLDSSVSNGLRFYPSSCPFRPGRPLGCLWVGWGMIWRRQSQPVRAQPQPSAVALFSSTTLGAENIYSNHLIRCRYKWKQYRIVGCKISILLVLKLWREIRKYVKNKTKIAQIQILISRLPTCTHEFLLSQNKTQFKCYQD